MHDEKSLAIKVSELSYRYSKALADALYIPHWQVCEGERIFLQGASGIGKTTLLQLLCGLKVGGGELCITGVDTNKLSRNKRDRFRARHIGMVFQQFNLIPYLSMTDNVVLAASLAGRTRGAKLRACSLLEQVGLPQTLWKQAAETLSIGQQQRVAIARALINTPPVLLLDEPTSALDDANQLMFMGVLQEHLDQNPTTTVVFVSHDSRLESYFDKSVALSELSSRRVSSEEISNG